MIRVLLVDDEPAVCRHLSTILAVDGDIEVVEAVYDGSAAWDAVVRTRPDVVLMDARMPGMDGVTATKRLTALTNGPYVVVLTSYDDDQVVSAAMRAGAAGFVLKHTPPADLAAMVRVAAAGHSVMSPQAIDRLTARTGDDPAVRAALGALTERELNVLELIGQGCSNARIASVLVLSETTVKGYVSTLLDKLACDNRTQAALIAFRYLPVTPR